ncbi:carbohydrate ABC transporter permease [Actinoalloteichus hymeniacidonis]|uniref:Permease component of ABC-type sugar transporter n=1 Tax=Actinoalloteichus hymeniacidonis TaxID=340345 RepID=A0AAC9MZB5_9PSEU|nr:sugar ABC transporter permease [Actinoalloteichus hymeniacidonis]AOS63887.1 permease component of ABC-type sugar transporter [Actinoalloteichus hymeniacidonis]MBB5908057.1 multiple sugar transport system permease protein [Actinoalloteichus hymeniacidonis]
MAVHTLEQENRRLKWMMLAPALLFIGVMIVFPILYTGYLSLTDAFGAVNADSSFIGLLNFSDALGDLRRFWPAVWRTLVFTVAAVALELTLGLALAMLLRKPFRGMRWVRTIMMVPLLATPVAVGVLWLLILDPTTGIANYLLGLVGIPPQPFLGSVAQSLPTLILIDVWQWTPMMTLLLLAGLSTLPGEPIEAALVDGASAWQRFRHVTLPMLTTAIVTALVLRSVDALKTFDLIYATKGPGGGSSHEAETLNVYAYGLTFDYQEYGLAASVLVVFTVLIIFIVVALRRRSAKASS